MASDSSRKSFERTLTAFFRNRNEGRNTDGLKKAIFKNRKRTLVSNTDPEIQRLSI